jgi:hypothetical protein
MTSPTNPERAVEVVQVDRDVAAPFAIGHGMIAGYTYSLSHLIRHGEADDHELVQAFARHRTASEARVQEGEAELCERCGGANPPWSAPSPLWNAVMRGGSINGEALFNDMVCSTCFMVLAEEKGIATLWRLNAERVNVPLETVTPSGRVWDEGRQLWVDALPATAPSEEMVERVARAIHRSRAERNPKWGMIGGLGEPECFDFDDARAAIAAIVPEGGEG